MLATVYLIISAVFGLTLVNFAVPDVRRLYVACAPSKESVSTIPNTLFTVPAGILVGIITTGFINYYTILGLSYFMDDHSVCKRIGMIITFAVLIWLSLSNLIIINRRRLKRLENKDFAEIPPYQYRLRDTLFYGLIIALITACATFLMRYTYRISDGELMAGLSTFSDLSPHTAMISSFSNGFNFPTQYMHFSGDGIQYHFLFYFFAGMLNYGGLQIDVALNSISILTMVSALTLLGLLAVLLSGKKGAFLFAPVLVFFRSAWNVFDHLSVLMKDKSLSESIQYILGFSEWYKVTDYDDWGIWAINVYPNQRHLMLGVGLILMAIILFIPFVRRMCTSMMSAGSFGGAVKAFLFSRTGWIPKRNDELKPGMITLLTCITVIVMPYYHGSALISMLLVLFGMAIFSECRLLHLAVAVCAVASSVIQTYTFSGGASNVVGFKYAPGFILSNPSVSDIAIYLLTITGLTLVLGILLAVIFLVSDIVRKKPVYRTLLFVCFLLPLIFGFNFKVTMEMLANHKFIQITLILVDAFVAIFLANLFSIPFSIRDKKEAAAADIIPAAVPSSGIDEPGENVKNLADDSDIDDEDLDLPEEIDLPDEIELPDEEDEDEIAEAIRIIEEADVNDVTEETEETEETGSSDAQDIVEESVIEVLGEEVEEVSEVSDESGESDGESEESTPGHELVPLTKSTDIVVSEPVEEVSVVPEELPATPEEAPAEGIIEEVPLEEADLEDVYMIDEDSDDESEVSEESEDTEEAEDSDGISEGNVPEIAAASVSEPKSKGISLLSFIALQLVGVILGFTLLIPLTATGISEWATYYNLNKGKYTITVDSPLAQWVMENTDTSDVFLTPMWSLHEFYLAGRASYYGWPYYAWSAGHDTDTREKIYSWLISGCGGDINEFVRYCKERNIRYLITDPEFTFSANESGTEFNWDFFAENLTQVAAFNQSGTRVYKIY